MRSDRKLHLPPHGTRVRPRPVHLARTECRPRNSPTAVGLVAPLADRSSRVVNEAFTPACVWRSQVTTLLGEADAWAKGPKPMTPEELQALREKAREAGGDAGDIYLFTRGLPPAFARCHDTPRTTGDHGLWRRDQSSCF